MWEEKLIKTLEEETTKLLLLLLLNIDEGINN